ncbi:hypothetical protein L3X38_010900 [Prunus dulcis]|uniref:Uncharacterized protein n=1 Tax=Prunus dulcis TaxID=3755 RepID=A0AAD4WI10_PRUDU|nr:hypothetical protein L3X38_010900 [Prunus dulcis]
MSGCVKDLVWSSYDVTNSKKKFSKAGGGEDGFGGISGREVSGYGGGVVGGVVLQVKVLVVAKLVEEEVVAVVMEEVMVGVLDNGIFKINDGIMGIKKFIKGYSQLLVKASFKCNLKVVSTGTIRRRLSSFESLHSATRNAPTHFVRLDQDILSPLAGKKQLYTYETLDFWEQIKTPG